MRNVSRTLTTIAILAVTLLIGQAAHAATTFTGGATDDIWDSANWSNGLPTSSTNVGTLSGDAQWGSGTTTLTNYYLETTGGTLTGSGFNPSGWVFEGGVQSFNGGSVVVSRNLSFAGDAVASVDNANTVIAPTQSGGDAIISLADTASLTVNAGTLDILDRIQMTSKTDGGASSFIVNGGTVKITNGYLGSTQWSSGSVYLNGGTVTAPYLAFGQAWQLTMGGTTAGTATFASGFGGNSGHADSNIRIDWLTGSQMELTVAGADWESLWNAGQLTVDGGQSGTFAENFTLTDGTLSVVPEPATMGLLAMGGLALLRRRRR